MSVPGGSRLYRRPPGVGWLVALIVVPLALALTGSLWLNRAGDSTPLPAIVAAATPTPSGAARPAVMMAPLSLQRSGNDVVISGQVADEPSRAYALDRIRTLLPGTNVIDLLSVFTGITATDLAGLDPVLAASTALPDFGFSIEGASIVLTGIAPEESIATGVERVVHAQWPDLTVVNDISVITPGFAPPQAPPGPGLTGECTDLQQRISGLLRTPIQYNADGSALAGNSAALINQLVVELRSCPEAKISITVHTDGAGTDESSRELSDRQARSLANAMIRQGVAADRIVSEGAGSAEQSENGRTEITVS